MHWLLLFLLFIIQNTWAATGGTPGPNPHPTPGPPPGQPQPRQPGQPNQPIQTGVNQTVTPATSTTNASNIQALTIQGVANSASTNQTAIALRGLILAPRQSFDVWANSTGTFTPNENIVCINAGVDYRLMPKWVMGLLGNWTMGRHISGSAMQGGLYTAFSQGGFYALASEIYHQEPETYITFAQAGYIVKLGPLFGGPFYSAQYGTKHGIFENQVGGWLNWPLGRFSPEVQVIWENNQKPFISTRRDFLWAGGTLNYEIRQGLFLSLGYNFEGNGQVHNHGITGGFKIQW
jgi:hypothetical protein